MQNPLVPVDEKTGILTDLLSVMENKVHDIWILLDNFL